MLHQAIARSSCETWDSPSFVRCNGREVNAKLCSNQMKFESNDLILNEIIPQGQRVCSIYFRSEAALFSRSLENGHSFVGSFTWMQLQKSNYDNETEQTNEMRLRCVWIRLKIERRSLLHKWCQHIKHTKRYSNSIIVQRGIHRFFSRFFGNYLVLFFCWKKINYLFWDIFVEQKKK